MAGKSKKHKKLHPHLTVPVAGDKDRLKSISLASGIVLDALLFVLAAAFIWKLCAIASNTMFFTDECFHNYIIKLTSGNWRVPGFLPDIYSGTFNNQPPLFHAMGAIFKGIFGEHSLRYFNVFLLAILLVAMYVLIRIFVNANAARLSVLFILAPFLIRQYSVVFYLEILSGITFFIALFLLFVAIEKRRYSFYIYAGIAGALMLVSKITSIIIIPFYFVILAFFLIRYFLKREKYYILAGMGIIIGVSLVGTLLFLVVATDDAVGFADRIFIQPVKTLVLPTFISTNGSTADHAAGSEKQIDKATEAWTIKNKRLLAKMVLDGSGILLFAGLIIAVIHAVIFFWKSKTLWLLIFLIYAFVIFLFTPAAADRHFIALLPIAAFLSGYALNNFTERLSEIFFKNNKTGLFPVLNTINLFLILCFAALFLSNTFTISKTGDLRATINASISMLLPQINYIRDNTPEDSHIFTMWAYETLYYSGRRSTWGANARGLRKIYFLENPDEVYDKLVDAGVTHLLIDFNMITTEDKYHTSLYTTTFIQNLVSLIKSGKAEMIYPTEISQRKPAILAGIEFTMVPYGKNTRFEIVINTPQGLARLSTGDNYLSNYAIIKLNNDAAVINPNKARND